MRSIPHLFSSQLFINSKLLLRLNHRIIESSILLSIFLLAAPIFGQDSTGRIVGVVTDPQKAAISGARITITDVETRITRTTTSGDDGAYQVLQLPIGSYSVTAEQSGFAKVVIQAQSLRINQALRVDIAMQVGQVSDTVQVEADASAVETVISGLGSTVTQKTISSMPLNGRNTLDLALLQPGVTA